MSAAHVPARLEQASLGGLRGVVMGRHVAAFAILAGTLAHAQPDQQHEEMAQGVATGLAVVHAVLDEKIVIVRQRIAVRVGPSGRRHFEHRRVTLGVLAEDTGEGHGHAFDIAARRGAAIGPIDRRCGRRLGGLTDIGNDAGHGQRTIMEVMVASCTPSQPK